MDVFGLLDYLSELSFSRELKLATARCYRRWLAAYLEDEDHPDANRVRYWVIPHSPEYYDLLMSATDRLEADKIAAALFTGTIMLGLRPREWQHATYNESFTDPFTLLTLGPVVEVFTLKQQRRRDDNPLREKRLLVLDQLRKPELALIKGLLTIVHSHDDNIDKMLMDVRKTLSTAWKRLVKEGKVKPTNKIKKKGRASDSVGSTEISDGYGVNLYTARHIFAEEVKRSGLYTRFELAAMIGHTTTVNQRYYTLGRKYILKTYPHTLPRPWPGDAADIEQWCNDTLSTLSANDIERLRSDGVFYPESNTKDELERVDSLEDFFNR